MNIDYQEALTVSPLLLGIAATYGDQPPEDLPEAVDRIGELFAQAIAPADTLEELPGSFFFMHDGNGFYRLRHACSGCTYELNRLRKDPNRLEEFGYALSQGWLSEVTEFLVQESSVH